MPIRKPPIHLPWRGPESVAQVVHKLDQRNPLVVSGRQPGFDGRAAPWAGILEAPFSFGGTYQQQRTGALSSIPAR